MARTTRANRSAARAAPRSAQGPRGTNALTGSSRYRAAAPARITHLRVRGSGRHVELPAVASYTLGRAPAPRDPKAPRADVLLPSPRKGMSLVHAHLEWRQDLLWCKDAGSTNGTHADHEVRHDWFTVKSGMRLDLGETSVIAMDWRLAELVEPLAWCLGLAAHDRIDRALTLLQKEGPLLLVGPRDGDQEWLARRIHAASPRREQPFVAFTSRLGKDAAAEVTRAGFGTVFVDLARVGKVTARFAGALFAGDGTQLARRPIVAAPDHDTSHRAFSQLGQGHAVELPSLALRQAELVPMLDRLMKDAGSPARVRDLGEPWASRLADHRFASLAELREAAERVRAWLETRNLSESARRVGTSRQAFTKYLERLFGRDGIASADDRAPRGGGGRRTPAGGGDGGDSGDSGDSGGDSGGGSGDGGDSGGDAGDDAGNGGDSAGNTGDDAGSNDRGGRS